jgi:hypothetical protein
MPEVTTPSDAAVLDFVGFAPLYIFRRRPFLLVLVATFTYQHIHRNSRIYISRIVY